MAIVMNDLETRTHRTFRALMWALSHPGRPQALPGAGLAPFLAIGETLVDLETSYYTGDEALGQLLARLGGRPRPPGEAAYQFYPVLDDAALSNLKKAPVGAHAWPDDGATLAIGASFGAGVTLKLSGPGVAWTTELTVGRVPDAFWSLRQGAIQYPLGWDVFLVGDGRVVGLPRTTDVEVN